jgi:hypothetical protein
LVDNCAPANVIVTGVRSDGLALTENYQIGITTITWYAKDEAGNVLATCTQKVNVMKGAVLVNYTFHEIHKATAYPYSADETAPNIVSYVTSIEPYHETSSGAVRTGPLAFKENLKNNGALVMQPSCGDNMRFFQFIVTGEDLDLYGKFQVYLQAQGHPHAATMLTLRYSTNGVDYTDGGMFTIPDHTHFFEHIYDLSGIAQLNTYDLDTLFIRLYTSGSHDGHDCGSYRIEIDNFQVYAERPDLMAAITSHTDILCRGENSGAATVTARGGTPPYTYEWNTVPVETLPTISNLAAGTYTVVVRDTKGCEASASVTIVVEPDITKPVITSCAPPQTVSASPDHCTLPVPDFTGNITAADNCTPVSGLLIEQLPLAGTQVGIGTHSILLTVKDADGNIATCTTSFTVNGFIVANHDTIYASIGNIGVIGNMFTNDLMHCHSVQAEQVIMKLVSALPYPEDMAVHNDGTIDLLHSLQPGTYTFRYSISDKDAPVQYYAEANVVIILSDPLPITTITLTATRVEKDVHLHWRTEAEYMTSHFSVEMSLDGSNFKTVPAGSKILAANISETQKNYYMVDPNVPYPIIYYRVRLFHQDGTSKLSNMVAVTMKEITQFRVYPNPVRGFVTIDFPENGVYAIDLITDAGQVLRLHRELNVTNGMRNITIARGNIISGAYIIRVINLKTGKVYKEKLIYLP